MRLLTRSATDRNTAWRKGGFIASERDIRATNPSVACRTYGTETAPINTLLVLLFGTRDRAN